MWKALYHNKWCLSILSGILVFIAFPKWELLPTIFIFPIFLNRLAFVCKTSVCAFSFGFLTSLVIMLGGFYWVTYVIHEFGLLPWSISAILYMGFCGFGALNFPLFVCLVSFGHRFFPRAWNWPITHVIALPALFVLLEFWIPKLFPWYVCHCLYWIPWSAQIADITGCTFLSFCIYSLGSSIGFLFEKSKNKSFKILAIPGLLCLICIAYGVYKYNFSKDTTIPFRAALIQGNIGSLEKMEAGRGVRSKIRQVVDTYIRLSEEALQKPTDLIVWPETALPFYISESQEWGREILDAVRRWKIPLITGAYAPGLKTPDDFNSAYLIEPNLGDKLIIQNYHKNVLLAFGEYMPLGELFPSLYKKFPEVSRFERGSDFKPLVLRNGIKLGITICYEAILPHFVRKIAHSGIHAHVNLTNDSWFGPTSEPVHHAALSIFRSIETRAPLLRVTNTGVTLVVDSRGRIGKRTSIFEEGILHANVEIPLNPAGTFYVRYGDWFIGVCIAILALFIVVNYHKRMEA